MTRRFAVFSGMVAMLLLAAGAAAATDLSGSVRKQDFDHGKVAARLAEYERAADAGDVSAQYALENFYFWGKQCFQADYAKASKWYRMAADQGHLDSTHKLAWIFMHAVNPPQAGKAHNLWMKAAQRGYGKSMFLLGRGFERGWWTGQPDPGSALEWYGRAVRAGYVEAYNELGNYHSSGRGGLQDHEKAAEMYRMAAKAGDGPAQYNLGAAYETGRGVPKNYEKAAALYRQAAEQGFTWPMFRLGILYEWGRGVKQSYGHAAKWYREAAMQGYDEAQYAYGRLLETGRGTIRSKLLAAQQYDQAARQGHRDARASLDRVKKGNPGIKLPEQYSSATKACMS
jgi:TPR repeat protein